MEVLIRKLNEADYPLVKEIYQMGIDTGHATFETSAPEWKSWNQKFLKTFRLLAVENNEIIGWAALSAVSERCVYAGVCEVSCYVHPAHQGKGIGKMLLQSLISDSEENNIWTLQAGIFPENISSIQLHKRLDFREAGYRERIGKVNGCWRNVLLFERRSKIAGSV
jgi:L-amino acid N-acyltransferase YncA